MQKKNEHSVESENLFVCGKNVKDGKFNDDTINLPKQW